MPLPALALLAYAALLAITILGRARYRTLAGLLLAAGAALGAAIFWLGNARNHVQAPSLASQAVAELESQAWPSAPQDIARIVASFQAVGDRVDENAARFAYARSIERAVSGDPPLSFPTVGVALGWIKSLPPHNRKFSQWQEIEEVQERALRRLVEVRFADTSDGWPSTLVNGHALRRGSRLVAPGVWEAAVDGRSWSTLQFALQVRNLGLARIKQAVVNFREGALPDPPEPADTSVRSDAARGRINCSVHIENLDPGESSVGKCEVQAYRKALQLEHIARLRDGAITLEPKLVGSFQYALADPPQAEPLNADRAAQVAAARIADAARIRDEERLRAELEQGLILVAVLGVGFFLPGIRRRPIGVVGTLALVVGGAAAALAYATSVFAAQGVERGWLGVISLLVSLCYDTVFLGGILLANLALQRSAPRPLHVPATPAHRQGGRDV